MSKELMQMPVTEIMTIGKAFVESGMFPDVKTAAQAVVKIQAGQEIGIAPFAAMTGIHIIAGKPTIGAGLIASKIKSSGKYDYQVIEMSDTKCSLDFFEGKKKIGNSTFTIEEARKAGTKNLDKFPKNMLFARAISNGVKWFTPDVFAGPVYTPEEMNGVVTDDTTAEEAPPTTLYNHKNIEKDGKPLITNEQFKELCDKVRKGNEEAYSVAMQTFSFEENQRQILDVVYSESQKPFADSFDDNFLLTWEAELSKCKTESDLLYLYNGNKATVESDYRVKELFSKRKKSFRNGVAAK